MADEEVVAEEVGDVISLPWTMVSQGIANSKFLAVIVLVVVIAAMVSARAVGEEPLAKRYPYTCLALDIVLVPLVVLSAGGLSRIFAADVGLATLNPRIHDLTIAVLAIASAWLAGRAVDLVFWRGYLLRRTGHVSPSLFRILTYGLLFGIAALVILARAGYSLTGLALSTGVAAALLGLALQNTLADVLSGIALSLDRAFEIGDWIELDDGTLGEVIEISWRSTQLLSFYNSVYVVPNGQLAHGRIHNFHRPRRPYSVWYEIAVPPDVEPNFVRHMLLGCATRCRFVLKKPPPTARLSDISKIPYTYMLYVTFASFVAQYPGRDALFQEIDAMFKKRGVTVAMPAQEIRYRRAIGTETKPPGLDVALRTVDVFASLEEQQLQELAAAASYEIVEPETDLMREGELAEHISFVITGNLEARFELPSGKMSDPQPLGPGDSFGQYSVITGEPALLTVTSVSEALIIRIRGRALRPIIQDNEELRDALARTISARLESRERARALAAAREKQSSATSSYNDLRAIIEKLWTGR